jgi:hypothetical protein
MSKSSKRNIKHLHRLVEEVEWVPLHNKRGVQHRKEKVVIRPTSPPSPKQSSPSKRARQTSPTYPGFSGDGDITMDCDMMPPRKASRKTKVSNRWAAIDPLLISRQSQNDFLRDWLPFRDQYLYEMLTIEALRPDSKCAACGRQDPTIRCTDCFGSPGFCKPCIVVSHRSLPFHRIQTWNGKCFLKSSLLEEGFTLYIGHGGQPCPSSQQEVVEWEDEMDLDTNSTDPLEEDIVRQTTMTIVHSSGIFQHHVQFCTCSGPIQKHIQLFREGLFPASITNPKTCFTFDVLDHFHMDAMECKSSAMSFYQKLKRFTNNIHPTTVPVRFTRLRQ